MSLAIISACSDTLKLIKKDFTGELDFKTTSDVMISVDDLPGVIGIHKLTVNKVRDIIYNNNTVSIIADVTVPNLDAYKKCLNLCKSSSPFMEMTHHSMCILYS